MCINGDLIRLRHLLALGGIAVGARSLCNAAAFNRLEILRFLVKEQSADVNQAHQDGVTSFIIS
jgi:hypothetical protein